MQGLEQYPRHHHHKHRDPDAMPALYPEKDVILVSAGVNMDWPWIFLGRALAARNLGRFLESLAAPSFGTPPSAASQVST
jgi:hypothetical protein